MDEFELLAAEAYGDHAVIEVIRPSAVLPEDAARGVLVALGEHDLARGGAWEATPSVWKRYAVGDGEPVLLGTLQVAYGTPTKYEITIFRATLTTAGTEAGWTVESLCDEALGYGGYTLATCPRAQLRPPPKPFRLGGAVAAQPSPATPSDALSR